MHLCHMKMRMTNDYTEIIYFDVRLGCQKMTRPCILDFFLVHNEIKLQTNQHWQMAPYIDWHAEYISDRMEIIYL